MPFPALRLLARSLTFKGHNILSVLLTGLSPLNFPELPPSLRRGSGAYISVLPHRRWPSGRVETLGIYQYPRKSDSLRGAFFDASYERSLSLRPSRLLASLSDRTGTTGVLPAHRGFYVPASGRRVTPTSVGI